MLTAIIVIIFVIGLIMFIAKLPDIKKAAKQGWQEGKTSTKKK